MQNKVDTKGTRIENLKRCCESLREENRRLGESEGREQKRLEIEV
jgi:hypothetical protein